MPTQRRKHVPLRTCVVCRQQRAKRDLVRVVRTPEGLLEVDARGKRPGRGAYLCRASACWDAAEKGHLARALKCEVSPVQLAGLRAQVEALLTVHTAGPAEPPGSRGPDSP